MGFQVVMRIIPVDEVSVASAVQLWDDELHFESSVGRLCDLNRHSVSYEYRAVKVKSSKLRKILSDLVWNVDEDYVIRPTNAKGKTVVRITIQT